MNETDRGHWGSRLGFIAAAAGSAIGLGNIWRFPYITGKLVVDFCLDIYTYLNLVGYPVMNSELLLGVKHN